VGVVQLVPPGGADMRGWVDAGRGCGCMVVGGGVDMCVRQLFGCRGVVLETFCPWWPSFPGNPSLGVRSLRRETGSNICAVAASIPGPSHTCHCRGPRGYNLDGERPHQRGAGWLCCAPTADCGCPDWSLTAKALSRFGWTAEGPWASSETRPCTDGALWIWRTAQTTDRALGGFWVGP
jgi:hypothetical protein